MESSSNQTSSGNEEEDQAIIQFNPMVSRGSNKINRSDSAVSKSSGKSLDSTISKSSLPISEGGVVSADNYQHAKIDSTTSPRDSIFSNSNSSGQIFSDKQNNYKEQLNETDLLLYNECYTQVLRQLRRRREDDMKRARRTLEESQWLLDLQQSTRLFKILISKKGRKSKITKSRKTNLIVKKASSPAIIIFSSFLKITQIITHKTQYFDNFSYMNASAVSFWKATNVQKKFSKHNSITSELETVQEELEQARQVFLGRQKLKSVERKSSFSKPKDTKSTKSVVFNRKVAVSQPSNLQVVPSKFEKPSTATAAAPTSLRPPSFSTTSLDTKYTQLEKMKKTRGIQKFLKFVGVFFIVFL